VSYSGWISRADYTLCILQRFP